MKTSRIMGCFVMIQLCVCFPTSGKASEMTVAQIVCCYDKLEDELLARYNQQLEKKDPALEETIKALGHIRSQKALPVLLKNIGVAPSSFSSGFEPVLMVSGGKPVYNFNLYVTFDAIKQIGISLDDCIDAVDRADGSNTPISFYAQLGYMCHGDEFIKKATERAKNKDEKWVRALFMIRRDEKK